MYSSDKIDLKKKIFIISTITILILSSCGRGKRVGAVCNDGSRSSATGSGACSHHGGVDYWIYENNN